MKYRKTVGDSWKLLQGYTMQFKQNAPGYSLLTFTKQIENVMLGVDVKANDDGTTEISNEYVYEIFEEEEYFGATCSNDISTRNNES